MHHLSDSSQTINSLPPYSFHQSFPNLLDPICINAGRCNRLQQSSVNSANNNANAKDHHSFTTATGNSEMPLLANLRCHSCGSLPTKGSKAYCPSLVTSVCNSHHVNGDWLDSPTVQNHFLLGRDPNNNPTNFSFEHHPNPNLPPPNAFLHPWYLNRKRKYARNLQYRRWSGFQQPQQFPIPLLNSQQQHFVQFPVNLLEQPLPQQQQRQAFLKHPFQDMGPWQGTHSFLVPISEEDEDGWQFDHDDNNSRMQQHYFITRINASTESLGASITNNQHPPSLLQSTPHLYPLSPLHKECINTCTSNNYTKRQQKNCRKQKVRIRKSKSESFLAITNTRYKRLSDCNVEEANEETALTEPNSDIESDQEDQRPNDEQDKANASNKIQKSTKPSTLSSRLKQSSSSLSSLISNTIQESFKMFRTLKLH